MRKLLIPLFAALLVFGLFHVPDVAAQVNNGFISTQDNPTTIGGATGQEGNARTLVVRIIDFFLKFLGLIAVLMLVYGGFLYMTSGGEDTEKAKKVILYAIIGIVVILLSFAIVNTVLTAGQ